MKNIIEIKDLGFDYGEGWVFHKLNLEIAEGDFVEENDVLIQLA